MDNLTRRNIRYICFRIQTEAEGGNKATVEETGVMSHVEEVKKHMEEQEEFGGWNKFAKTWDIDEKAKLVAVNRTSSIQSEWNKVLKKQAKNLPVAPKKEVSQTLASAKVTVTTSTTPPRGPGGKFISKSKKTQTAPLAEVPSPKAEVTEEKKKSFWKRLV